MIQIIYGWMAREQVNSSHVTEWQLRLIAAKNAWRLGYAALKR